MILQNYSIRFVSLSLSLARTHAHNIFIDVPPPLCHGRWFLKSSWQTGRNYSDTGLYWAVKYGCITFVRCSHSSELRPKLLRFMEIIVLFAFVDSCEFIPISDG
jgi:hypothetical protein